jgi:tetratricopeptide (TPR) repeat protein
VFITYPFSDPSPIPDPSSKIYPYFRYDGFTSTPQQKEWKVVEMENDYLKIMVLPEIGGKIWSAIEKKTNREFLYYNHVVKFRDVAMRGPWTSGGIEANYGIIGHTPNCATPVDYITMSKDDGSVSCIIGVLDLLTQTKWRLEINLPADKAFLTTRSIWFNVSMLEQPYYSWMNTGIKAKGNLEFIYPGNHYLGHEGEYGDWPVNKKNGKKISFYNQNDFGGYKSYHVFGSYTDFFGGYWHDDDYGMARYSSHDDKAGKKVWIWGLSEQGMIWEKLLTDNDGQYVEVQSGRLFNQGLPGTMYTPFKYRSFTPGETDEWTEYWFPVLGTKGFVKANQFGALNVRREEGWLKINFCAVQKINEDLEIHTAEGNHSLRINLLPLQNFSDSIHINSSDTAWSVAIGNIMDYDSKSETETVLGRPIQTPADFDWKGLYGLWLAGRSFMEQRKYPEAYEKIKACLGIDRNYIPALSAMSELEYRRLNYNESFEFASRVLAINTYDAAANYFYGLAALKLNRVYDAKDGFDIASQSAEFRIASYNRLAEIYFKEKNYDMVEDYIKKSLAYNQKNLEALQLMALLARKTNDEATYGKVLQLIAAIDPLSHFVLFEKYFSQPIAENKEVFQASLQSEMPSETCMDLVVWYYRLGYVDEIKSLLAISPGGREMNIWKKYFAISESNSAGIYFYSAFPFRPETAELLERQLKKDSGWQMKYAMGLIYQGSDNSEKAKPLFIDCGDQPDDPVFYAVRAAVLPHQAEPDLKKAISLDKEQWRFYKLLGEYYLREGMYDKAVVLVEPFYKSHPENYIIGMLYAKSLLLNQKYKDADLILSHLKIIPFEGATEGRQLYREAKLMETIQELRAKNYKKALAFISEAKLWPENLGEGKPYDKDIDERLENWMSYVCYSKIGNAKEANSALKKILDFDLQTDNTLSNIYTANALVTAWAMSKTGKTEEGSSWLNEQIRIHADDKILLWTRAAYSNKQTGPPPFNDATARILQAMINGHSF